MHEFASCNFYIFVNKDWIGFNDLLNFLICQIIIFQVYLFIFFKDPMKADTVTYQCNTIKNHDYTNVRVVYKICNIERVK
jgi:hypothetical protein